jgi:NDP-sugar pyrophosphorylase family protein
MKAMILAAGLGTRLRPLTDDRPKALVELSGRTLLDITLERLKESGVREVIVNVHHFADMVIDHLDTHDSFGMRIEVSREETLLDTGGGLRKAAWFFLEDDRLDEPFVLHNVDIISTIDLDRMIRHHRNSQSVATLAVQDRETSRKLLFDEQAQLCGRRRSDGAIERVESRPHSLALAFSGVHVISPRLLPMMREEGVFSIIDEYMRLASRSLRIGAFRADEYSWRDVGRPESVRQAVEDESA